MSKSIRRFLVLDPDPAHYLFFVKVLQCLGHTHVSHATTGRHALELVDKESIQFLICAWEIPDMSGASFIQKVRSKPRRLFTPALLYCKSMDAYDTQLAMECGFENILNIPFDAHAAKKKLADMIQAEEELTPKEVKLRRIEEYLRQNHTSEAYPMFTNDLFIDKGLAHRTFGLFAEVNLQVGNLEKAHQSITKAYSINPHSPYVKRVYGHILSRRGDHDNALRIYKELVENSPYNLQHKLKLGEAYYEAERYDEAEKTFEEVYQADEERQDVRDNIAKIAFRKGNFDKVKRLLSESSNGSELVRAFNNMAVGLVKKQEFDDGIKAYQEAISLLHDKTQIHLIHYNLGLAYKKQGNIYQAFESFAQAFAIQPEWTKSWAALMKSYQEARSQNILLNQATVDQVKSTRARLSA